MEGNKLVGLGISGSGPMDVAGLVSGRPTCVILSCGMVWKFGEEKVKPLSVPASYGKSSSVTLSFQRSTSHRSTLSTPTNQSGLGTRRTMKDSCSGRGGAWGWSRERARGIGGEVNLMTGVIECLLCLLNVSKSMRQIRRYLRFNIVHLSLLSKLPSYITHNATAVWTKIWICNASCSQCEFTLLA